MKRLLKVCSCIFNFKPLAANRFVRLISFLITGALILSAAIMFAAQAYNWREENSKLALEQPKSTAPVEPSSQPYSLRAVPQGQRVEAELITVLPTGFDPKEINRPAGAFLIAVENRSGLDELELRLDREAGSRLHQVPMPGRKLNWKQGVDLPPGRYLLTEANHPDWRCRITITP